MPTVSIADLTGLVTRLLECAGASPSMALATAKALVDAEAQGLAGHGVSRAPLYAEHLRQGRVNGRAQAKLIREKGGTCLVDAAGGLAYEAAALAVAEAIRRAADFGIAFSGVTNSHHFGAAAYHLQPVAEAGLVGLALTMSPAAINAWGGTRPLFGTNPIAAVFPRKGAPSIIVDLSLSKVARGSIMLAAKQGKPIPTGWALDRDGRPTTDATAALTGSMVAIGGVKGAMLALAVELICVALTGAAFGFENDSFFEPGRDRKSTRLNSSHSRASRMPSSA